VWKHKRIEVTWDTLGFGVLLEENGPLKYILSRTVNYFKRFHYKVSKVKIELFVHCSFKSCNGMPLKE
jgi:hypothetical protein